MMTTDTFHVNLVAKNSLGTPYTLRDIKLAFEADGEAAIVEADALGDRTIPPHSIAQVSHDEQPSLLASGLSAPHLRA